MPLFATLPVAVNQVFLIQETTHFLKTPNLLLFTTCTDNLQK
jgi:hypothetical protein